MRRLSHRHARALGIPTVVAVLLVAAFVAAVASCGRQGGARPEPQCTADTRTVECWWVLYGCMPDLAPRDACLAICQDQERGQLKVCEGRLPHRPDTILMSVRHLSCDRCIRFSDKPLGKR